MAINITSGESLIGKAYKKKYTDDRYIVVVGILTSILPEGLTPYSDVGLDLFYVAIDTANKERTFLMGNAPVAKLLNPSYFTEDESKTLQYKLLYEKNKNEEKWWIE